MELALRIGVTEQSIREHLHLHPDPITCDAVICKYEGKWAVAVNLSNGMSNAKFVLSSQRSHVRRFATLESANKACNFADNVSVVDK